MIKMLKALTVAASLCLVLGFAAQANAKHCGTISMFGAGYGNPGCGNGYYGGYAPSTQVKVYKVTKIIKYRKKKKALCPAPAACAPTTCATCKPVCAPCKPACKPACTPCKPVCAPVCTPCKPVCKPACKPARKPLFSCCR